MRRPPPKSKHGSTPSGSGGERLRREWRGRSTPEGDIELRVLTERWLSHAIRYVLKNWIVHARREGWPLPQGIDPYCSTAWRDRGKPLVAEPVWWMLCVGVKRFGDRLRAA